jgi:hypothetical protein
MNLLHFCRSGRRRSVLNAHGRAPGRCARAATTACVGDGLRCRWVQRRPVRCRPLPPLPCPMCALPHPCPASMALHLCSLLLPGHSRSVLPGHSVARRRCRFPLRCAVSLCARFTPLTLCRGPSCAGYFPACLAAPATHPETRSCPQQLALSPRSSTNRPVSVASACTDACVLLLVACPTLTPCPSPREQFRRALRLAGA